MQLSTRENRTLSGVADISDRLLDAFDQRRRITLCVNVDRRGDGQTRLSEGRWKAIRDHRGEELNLGKTE